MCPPLDFQEYLDLREFRAPYVVTPTVASSSNIEKSIAIQIIYVNKNDGTPAPKHRVSELIDKANEIYDGFLNFYVCSYRHLNSTQYNKLHPNTANKTGLYNLYHSETAVNVYIVDKIVDAQGISNAGGTASFPNFTNANNFIAIASNSYITVLAHELGHYFGLSHTHSPNYYVASNAESCLLVNPIIDVDQVSDTPPDPGPNSVCIAQCPIATSSCTLSCDNSFNDFNPQSIGQPATFTFPAGYLTNNVMSYYEYCTPRQLTQGQIALMSAILNDPLSKRYFLNTAPSCNNEIAEDGVILKYCQNNVELDKTPLKSLLVNINNEITNWETTGETEPDGTFKIHQQNLSNQVFVSVKPEASHPLLLTNPGAVSLNYQPWNGVTVNDISRVQRHILAIEPLEKPFNWIAADVNNSGSITTFDIIQMRKIILGLQTDFTAGTYRFVPGHYMKNSTFVSNFENNPFTASYNGIGYPAYLDSELLLDMDDAAVAEAQTWSYAAIKVGDVNCNMTVEEFGGGNDGGLLTIVPGTGPCLSEGDIVTVDILASGIMDIVMSYQMGMTYDTVKLSYMGVTSGDFADFKFDNFVVKDGKIRTLWYKDDGSGEIAEVPKILFKLNFKVKSAFCDINQVTLLDDEILTNVFYGKRVDGSTSANLTFNWTKNIKNPKGSINSIFPNPAVGNLSFDLHLDQTSNVKINVWDFQGSSLSHEYQYVPGNHTFSFQSISALSPGPLNYTVKIDDFTYSGIVIKAPN